MLYIVHLHLVHHGVQSDIVIWHGKLPLCISPSAPHMDLIEASPQSANVSVEQLVARLRRRDVVSSRAVALETAQLLYRLVGQARFSDIDSLLDQIKQVGRKLVAANPKEPAVGNIVRKVLRLIREEYKSAYAAHLQSHGLDEDGEALVDGGLGPSTPDSALGGPMPPTPGIHVPATHFLSDEYRNQAARSTSPVGTSSRPQPSLGTFVQMRHTRAQLERARSSMSLTGLAMSGLENGPAHLGLSSSTNSSGAQSPVASPPNEEAGAPPNIRRTSFPGLRAPLDDGGPGSPTSSNRMSAKHALAKAEFGKKVSTIKPVLLDAIREVVDEIETTHESCAKGARDHIHSSEIILTLGCSRTVEAFLRAAKKERDFTVIVAETSPSDLGHKMAQSLSAHGIQTLLVPDNAIFAVMPRVTKVVLGAHSVLANGGAFAASGSLAAALAARYHATPVVVISGQYKFAPARDTYHEYAALEFVDPAPVKAPRLEEEVEVVNPFYDYVKPDLINLFITNE